MLLLVCFFTFLDACFGCRHFLASSNVSFTALEGVLLFLMLSVVTALGLFLPRVLILFAEIRAQIVERRHRFLELRKMQKGRGKPHIPIHFLRSHYEDASAASSRIRFICE
uniref:Uncharacterized protein n=1 Tax=Panagrolaimus sp. JU765 TaxID=591449 RepID=A0AC34QVJ5_9BILA